MNKPVKLKALKNHPSFLKIGRGMLDLQENAIRQSEEILGHFQQAVKDAQSDGLPVYNNDLAKYRKVIREFQAAAEAVEVAHNELSKAAVNLGYPQVTNAALFGRSRKNGNR